MVMLFLDESSNFGRSDFVCVAGYIGSDAGWEDFAGEWRQLLKKHNLPYLHAADFMAGEGVYSGLHLDRPKRLAIIKEFFSPIRKHVHSGFGVGVEAKHFREIVGDVRKRARPETFCFQRVMKLVSTRLAEWDTESYELFFDDVESYAMKVYKFICMLRRIDPTAHARISCIAFGRDEKWPPLQAADLLCCATSREHRFGVGAKAWSVDHSEFRGLLEGEDPAYGKPYFSEYWDKKMLDQHASSIRDMAVNSP
jgi:hypothetical protein